MEHDEVPTQEITISKAEPWMDKPIKVELRMQITNKTSSAQTFYLNEEEAEKLSQKLASYVFVLKGREE